jgi:hypothetical protein
MFRTDPILPPDPDGLEVLHDREYRVRAFRTAEDRLLIRGAVRDQKPPGMYIPDDPDPLTMHHMVVELEIDFPSLEIVRAGAVLEIHPHTTCPDIEPHYEQLVGLSIARGFTNRVRELFGGPRGCTHTTALIQAMAPVAVQCFWSMQASNARRAGMDAPFAPNQDETADAAWKYNIGSCHVWAPDGAMVAAVQAGAEVEIPVSIQRRMRELGRDPNEWISSRPTPPR